MIIIIEYISHDLIDLIDFKAWALPITFDDVPQWSYLTMSLMDNITYNPWVI